MEKVKVAIISAGGAGQAHIHRFLNNQKSLVRGVYDPNIENLKKLQFSIEKNGGYITTDLEKILDDTEVDLVSVCSPDNTHFDYIEKVIRTGKHILVEKPLVVSLQELRALKRMLGNFKKVFGVHHQMRYLPAFMKARESVIAGEIGLPCIAESDYIHDMRERASVFDNWRTNPSCSQKVSLGASCHTIDLVRWTLDDEVVEVFSYSSHIGWTEYPDEDTVLTVLKFKKGAIGKVLSTISCRRPQYNSLIIYGTDGNIISNVLLDQNGFKKFLHLPKTYSKKQKLTNFILRRTNSTQAFPFSINEHELACQLLIDNFLNCIIEKRPFNINFSESAYTIQICLASIESYKRGCPIKIVREF